MPYMVLSLSELYNMIAITPFNCSWRLKCYIGISVISVTDFKTPVSQMFQDGLNEVNPFSFFYHSIIEGSVIKFT